MVRIREKLTAKINICAIQALEKRKFWTTTILMKMNSIVYPNYKTYNNLATSLRYLYDHPEYELKKFRKVIKYYKKSLQQQINDIANRNMGVMYFKIGKYRTALNYLTQVQKVSTYTLYNIAGCYFQIKEFQKSYSCFQKIRYEMNSEDTVEYRIQMLLCMLESAIKLRRKDQIEGLWEELSQIESHPRMEILYLANKLGIQQFVVDKWKKTIEEYNKIVG